MRPIIADDNGCVRTVGVEELVRWPFVRHQTDPSLVGGAWERGRAAAVLARRHVLGGEVTSVAGFGPEPDLAALLEQVARTQPRPDRVMVDAAAATIPAAWPLAELRHWHWMLTTTPPPPDPLPVEDVEDPDEVDALLDAAAHDSHARPGTPGVESWLGIRESGALVAVGAVVRQPDGTGHLRAITVAPDRRGRGLGRALSTAMTRRAMAETGVCSLGVYTDNAPALAVYRRLGYGVVHTFASGPVSGRSSTTAVAPSR